MAILIWLSSDEACTPNQHNLARNFVTLDNFYDTAEVSNDGWVWTTSARAPDVVERQFPVAYAMRGLSLDTEGVNRNVNVAYATLAERRAAKSPYARRSGFVTGPDRRGCPGWTEQ